MSNGNAIQSTKTVNDLYRSSAVSSFEIATALSNHWAKKFNEYNTAVRVEIEGRMEWIVTNEFDLDVAAKVRELAKLSELGV